MKKKPAAKSRVILRPQDLKGAAKATFPRFIQPQLATLVTEAPEGDQWLHEIKFDGYRMLCRISGGKVDFVSRNEQTWTSRLPALVAAAQELPVKEAWLDGEVVTLKPDGRSDFQLLQNAFKVGSSSELIYYVFDLLHLNGYSLLKSPLVERKNLLAKILSTRHQGAFRYAEHLTGGGLAFFKEASQLGLEGIICKRADRPYLSGRSNDWLKVKSLQREEFVIGGFTEPSGSRVGIGALLVGYYDEQQQLTYCGKVGTGFDHDLLIEMRQRLGKMARKVSPFGNLKRPIGPARAAHWVTPSLVAQIAFTEWTSGGHLRHPVFLGLREDKSAAEVRRDKAIAPGQAKSSGARAKHSQRRSV